MLNRPAAGDFATIELDAAGKKRILIDAQMSAGEYAMSANWKAIKEDLDWSLNCDDDVKGRAELREAFNKGDVKAMAAVNDAFKMGQRDGHKVANFLRCAHEDDRRLYNIGRKLIDLKPV